MPFRKERLFYFMYDCYQLPNKKVPINFTGTFY